MNDGSSKDLIPKDEGTLRIKRDARNSLADYNEGNIIKSREEQRFSDSPPAELSKTKFASMEDKYDSPAILAQSTTRADLPPSL